MTPGSSSSSDKTPSLPHEKVVRQNHRGTDVVERVLPAGKTSCTAKSQGEARVIPTVAPLCVRLNKSRPWLSMFASAVVASAITLVHDSGALPALQGKGDSPDVILFVNSDSFSI
jgi:hypothetical protein